jgi:hypothetical protein
MTSSGAPSEVDQFMASREKDPSHTFKSELRALFDGFEASVGRKMDERERQAIVLWFAGEWISVAAFACGRVDASYDSVAEHMYAEFMRGLRKHGDDAAQAVPQGEGS